MLVFRATFVLSSTVVFVVWSVFPSPSSALCREECFIEVLMFAWVRVDGGSSAICRKRSFFMTHTLCWDNAFLSFVCSTMDGFCSRFLFFWIERWEVETRNGALLETQKNTTPPSVADRSFHLISGAIQSFFLSVRLLKSLFALLPPCSACISRLPAACFSRSWRFKLGFFFSVFLSFWVFMLPVPVCRETKHALSPAMSLMMFDYACCRLSRLKRGSQSHQFAGSEVQRLESTFSAFSKSLPVPYRDRMLFSFYTLLFHNEQDLETE